MIKTHNSVNVHQREIYDRMFVEGSSKTHVRLDANRGERVDAPIIQDSIIVAML